ncbi:MAG: hypothetical protein Alpg2KO_27690 [Alphaproteobacteria bacterium]
MAEYLPHILAALALVCNMLAFTLIQPRKVLAVLAGSNILWISHFLALGTPSGVVQSICSLIRNVSGAWLKTSHMIILTWLCVLPTLWIAMNAELAGLFLVSGAICRALGNHARDNPRLFRLFTLLSELGWIGYGLMVGSLIWVASILIILFIAFGPQIALFFKRFSDR